MTQRTIGTAGTAPAVRLSARHFRPGTRHPAVRRPRAAIVTARGSRRREVGTP